MKKEIKRKPTQEDFEYFKKCCQKYADKFELNNWTYIFHFKRDGDKEWLGGKIERRLDNLQADIYLDPNCLTDNKYIKETAKHEILHCLVGELYLLGISRHVQRGEIDKAEEALIHKLEKLLPDFNK